MKITEGKNSFQLIIVGYEFPEEQTDVNDSRWLTTRLIVSDSNGSGIAEISCLLTNEIEPLANWLDKTAVGDLAVREIEFLEPTISFHIMEGEQGMIFRVNFFVEGFPIWATKQTDYPIDFHLSKIDLKAAAEDLRKQIREYPQRG